MKFMSGFLLAAMTIVVFLQVLFRYVFNAPLDWSEEMASFAFVWMALLGASVGLRYNEHPRLDIIYNLMPAWGQKLSDLLINFSILFMLIMMMIFGWQLTIAMRMQSTAALGYSVSYVYVVLPLSATIMAVHVLVTCVRLLQKTPQEVGS